VEEYGDLVRFIREEPSSDTPPQLLVPVGTIKSGKSTLLARVIMSRAVERSCRKTPAYRAARDLTFSRVRSTSAAQQRMRRASCAQGIFVDPAEATDTALVALPVIAGNVTKSVRPRGRELWLLAGDAQHPVLGWELSGSVTGSNKFVQKPKRVRAAGALVHNGTSRWRGGFVIHSRYPVSRASVLPRSSLRIALP
jgi:hypothetical protein